MLFRGSGVALITPFTENGIDLEKLKELVEWHIQAGTQALIVLGTTGENPTLSEDEKVIVFKTVAQVGKGRICLIANTGDNSTSSSIERSQFAKDLGYDGLLLVVPYYNKPQQRGLIAHFTKIVDTVKLPAILYNVPGRTSLNMEASTTLHLAEHPYIVGVKEASHMDDQIKTIIRNAPNDFAIYCGNDDQNQDCLDWGADGLISVSANVVPALLQKQCEAMTSHHQEEAQHIHRQLINLHKMLFIETNPVGVKVALNAMGKNVGSVRLPLVDMEKENKETLINFLKISKLVELSI